jgi:hypothetical protein
LKRSEFKAPDGCIALDGETPLFGDTEQVESTFEREIGLTGEYKTRGFALARSQFEQIIANHKASGVDPAVDRGHETWFGSNPGEEARGWVRSLSIRPSTMRPGRDALVAQIELNDLGRNAVSNRHFRYVSMGLNLKGTDRLTGKPVGAVLDHLALVKRPEIEGMQPLSLSADEPAIEEKPMKSLLVALGVKDDATEADAMAALTAKMSGKDAEIIALKAESTALRAQNNAAEARLTALEAEAKAERLKRMEVKLDAKIAAFAVDTAEKGALMELAAVSPETFEKLLALRMPRDPSGPALKVVKGGVDKLALQNSAIEARMKLTGETYDLALIGCASENPSLFNEVA